MKPPSVTVIETILIRGSAMPESRLHYRHDRNMIDHRPNNFGSPAMIRVKLDKRGQAILRQQGLTHCPVIFHDAGTVIPSHGHRHAASGYAHTRKDAPGGNSRHRYGFRALCWPVI